MCAAISFTFAFVLFVCSAGIEMSYLWTRCSTSNAHRITNLDSREKTKKKKRFEKGQMANACIIMNTKCYLFFSVMLIPLLSISNISSVDCGFSLSFSTFIYIYYRPVSSWSECGNVAFRNISFYSWLNSEPWTRLMVNDGRSNSENSYGSLVWLKRKRRNTENKNPI